MTAADFIGTAGPAFDQDRDGERLTAQLERVKRLMLDGRWRTLAEISEATGDPHASVSAQLRHLRKRRFGAWTVERRHVSHGLFEYRVAPPTEESEDAPLSRSRLQDRINYLRRQLRQAEAQWVELLKESMP